jgi:hypothetical protein
MAVRVKVFMMLKLDHSFDKQLVAQPGQFRTAVHTFCEYLEEVADIAAILRGDGWIVHGCPNGLEFIHADVDTKREARKRLRRLGIDLSLVGISDYDDDEFVSTKDVETLVGCLGS